MSEEERLKAIHIPEELAVEVNVKNAFYRGFLCGSSTITFGGLDVADAWKMYSNELKVNQNE